MAAVTITAQTSSKLPASTPQTGAPTAPGPGVPVASIPPRTRMT